MKELLNGNMATGINIDETATPTIHCEACIQAKAVHQSFPKESSMRAEKPGDLTHSDLWGPAPKPPLVDRNISFHSLMTKPGASPLNSLNPNRTLNVKYKIMSHGSKLKWGEHRKHSGQIMEANILKLSPGSIQKVLNYMSRLHIHQPKMGYRNGKTGH